MTALRRLQRTAQPSRNKRAPLVAPSDLYEAGIARMNRVERTPYEKRDVQAVQYADGLMMAMLAAKPIRLRNLAGTRIGKNLFKRGEHYIWRFSVLETKNKEMIEAELPLRISPYIDRWLQHYREVLLRGNASDMFWISCYRGPMSYSSLYARFCSATRQELGVRINPHAVRDIVATGIAIALPDEVRMTPFLLDHRSDKTVNEHYNLADSLSASSRYLEQLEARRLQAFEGINSRS